MNDIKQLRLPGRFEQLKQQSETTGNDISGIIHPVDDACKEIETVLREINTSGLGRILILHGNSGSGKSTFLYGLKYFFDNVSITAFTQEKSIINLSEFVEHDSPSSSEHRLYIVDNRDNPSETDIDLKVSFEKLRNLFRTRQGQVLIVWPITDIKLAETISDIAWHIGRDSLLGTRYKVYRFVGLPKELFTRVADITTRALNAGENLESFGIDTKKSIEFSRISETIGEFYSRLNAFSAQKNDETFNILKTKIRPRVWIIVPGDDSKELDRTISSLTQGTRNRIDIDKIAEFLDNKDNQSIYLNDWRNRRSDMAYIMRVLDVRLFELQPNAALASIRHFGNSKLKEKLKKPTETLDNCRESLERSRLGQALINSDASLTTNVRDTSPEMANEYMMIQQHAAKGDSNLNKAIGAALYDYLNFQNIEITISSEKQNLPNSQICPDIQVKFSDGNNFCLELTWRSTGKYIKQTGHRKPQNTLSQGHIMKYVLEKTMEYVKDLGI